MSWRTGRQIHIVLGVAAVLVVAALVWNFAIRPSPFEQCRSSETAHPLPSGVFFFEDPCVGLSGTPTFTGSPQTLVPIPASPRDLRGSGGTPGAP